MADAQLTLINLDGEGYFTFQFFPEKAKTNDRANWEQQNTTIGVKPLFYSNRDPRRIDFDELYLDSTETNLSLTPEIKKLRSLMNELPDRGAPPALLAAWGDRQERCVLEELNVDEIYFNSDGHPTRVSVRLDLLQIQTYGESVTVTVLDDEGGIFGG